MRYIGIDVSHWNSIINFNKVKSAGFDFVIIKAGGSDKGFYVDSKFKLNYENAKKAGLHIGAYYFAGSDFITDTCGRACAKRFYDIIKDYQLDYPVFIDIEMSNPIHKKGATDAAIAFCDYMEQLGYFVGIYASDISGFKDKLDDSRLQKYCHWVARYSGEPRYSTKWGLWQHSSSGIVDGIQGRVDLDISKYDYSKIIRDKHKNGY